MKQDIVSWGDGLHMDDIEIYVGEANYCMKDKNPVDHVKFFKKPNYQSNQVYLDSFHIDQKKVSLLLPSSFSEKYLRLYVKHIEKVMT